MSGSLQHAQGITKTEEPQPKEEEEAEAEKPQQMNQDSQSQQDSPEKKKKKDPSLSYSSSSVAHYSPPSLRSRKPPSPPIPSSDDHSSATHTLPSTADKRSSPPARNSSLDTSSDSSISSDLCSNADGIPRLEGEGFFSIPPENPASPPVVVANRFQVEPKVVTKVDPGAQEGVVGVQDVEEGTGRSNSRRLRPDVHIFLRSEKEGKLNKALLGLRIIAFVLCLISFSVLAADTHQGWALDSFYLYKEFRYTLSVNVIGFMYSGLQISDLVKYFITKKYILEHPLRGYFNFSMDQILTYLLMSASSSAATRAYDWESNWGEDKFPYMANASVGLSFVAFLAFALTSLVSGYILCKFR